MSFPVIPNPYQILQITPAIFGCVVEYVNELGGIEEMKIRSADDERIQFFESYRERITEQIQEADNKPF